MALSVELGKLKSSDHKLAAEGSPKLSTQQKAGPRLEIQACGYLMEVSVFNCVRATVCRRFNIPSRTYFATWTINSTPVLSRIQLYKTCHSHKNKCTWQIALSPFAKKQITIRKAELSPAVNKWITQVKVIIVAVVTVHIKTGMYEQRA